MAQKNNPSSPTVPRLLAASTTPSNDDQLRYRDLEHILNVCERTIRRMVLRGELPPPARNGPGNELTWLAGDIAPVLEQRRKTST